MWGWSGGEGGDNSGEHFCAGAEGEKARREELDAAADAVACSGCYPQQLDAWRRARWRRPIEHKKDRPVPPPNLRPLTTPFLASDWNLLFRPPPKFAISPCPCLLPFVEPHPPPAPTFFHPDPTIGYLSRPTKAVLLQLPKPSLIFFSFSSFFCMFYFAFFFLLFNFFFNFCIVFLFAFLLVFFLLFKF